MHWVAPSEKDTANAALEKRLWDAAEQAASAPYTGLKSQEYCGGRRPQGRVLGLIFLRFAEVHMAAKRAPLVSPSPLGAAQLLDGNHQDRPVPSPGAVSTRADGECMPSVSGRRP